MQRPFQCAVGVILAVALIGCKAGNSTGLEAPDDPEPAAEAAHDFGLAHRLWQMGGTVTDSDGTENRGFTQMDLRDPVNILIVAEITSYRNNKSTRTYLRCQGPYRIAEDGGIDHQAEVVDFSFSVDGRPVIQSIKDIGDGELLEFLRDIRGGTVGTIVELTEQQMVLDVGKAMVRTYEAKG